MKFNTLFNKPKIIAICSDVNQGKSMLLYNIITELKSTCKFKLYSYGLRESIGDIKIHSVEELERIKNSIIILDEFFTLLDLDDRKKKKMIENTFRLIHHNNNIMVLSGVPENFKKFVSAKINTFFFKTITLSDLINGSRIKTICTNYKGNEMGAAMLNLNIDQCLMFDGKHYSMLTVEYMEKYDTKLNNQTICKERVKKKCDNERSLKCANNVHKK